MKFIKSFLFLGILFTFSSLMSSCSNTNKSSREETTMEKQEAETGDQDTKEMKGHEYTSAYVCPMHCEGSGSDEAGKCPVCGMDYVANEDHKSDGHSHDDHDGHNH